MYAYSGVLAASLRRATTGAGDRWRTVAVPGGKMTAPELQAKASAAVEIGSGAALALGPATPLSASAVVGTMSVAYVSVHRPNGYFVIKEGWEYAGFISAASLAASALGGGQLSVDRLLGLHTAGTPVARAAITAAVGVAGAAVQLVLFWRSPQRASR